MFSKLKDKLKNWTKSLSKKAEEIGIQEEIIDVSEKELPKTKESKKEIHEQKRAEKKAARKSKKQEKKKSKEEISQEIPEIPESEIEKTETITELLETPKKFNAGTKSYEPDFEKIKKIEKDLLEQKKVITKETSEKEPKEKKSFFQKFKSKINKVKISEENFNEYSEDLEMLLLENNVALEVAEKIIYELKNKLIGKEILKKELESEIKDSFRDAILKILIEPFDLIEKIKLHKGSNSGKPYVILFCGINGTGKTTTIAKLGNFFKKKNLSCIFAAGDTFRAASIEQLKTHGERLKINVIAHEYNSDPAAVGFDAIKYAEKNKIDVVLIDTAGRMHTEKNLMAQIEKISKVTNPDCKIFVGESITGNDIIEQVKTFNSSIQIDGIILNKADIDEKGGTALSVGYITKKPILYLGTGQNYEDFEVFDKNKFIEKLGFG